MLIIKTGLTDQYMKITPADKIKLLAEWQTIAEEKPVVLQLAADAGMTEAAETLAYVVAYNQLYRFLWITPSPLADMDTITFAEPDEYQLSFRNYYQAKQAVELKAVIPPDDELSNLSLEATDNGDGTVRIDVAFTVTAYRFPASHYLLYYKADISPPAPIDKDADLSTAVRSEAGKTAYTISIDVPVKSGSSALHYGFGLAAVILRGAAFVYAAQGLLDQADWRDQVYTPISSFTALNYWHYNTGEFRAGNNERYFHANPEQEIIDIGGYKLPGEAIAGIDEILARFQAQLMAQLSSVFKIGQIASFMDKSYKYGWLYCDGSVFFPSVYKDFYAYWLDCDLGNPQKKGYCGRDGISNYPRLPDLRGVYEVGVDDCAGMTDAQYPNEFLPDGIRNIKGDWNWTSDRGLGGNPTGALYQASLGYYAANALYVYGATTGIGIDVSRVVPTAPVNRPRTKSVYKFIRVL